MNFSREGLNKVYIKRKAGHPIGIAHTQFEKEDDTPACDVQVYVNFNQLELKQEIITDDQQIHQVLEKNYTHPRTLS